MEINKILLPSPNNSEIDPTVTGLCFFFCGTKFISESSTGAAWAFADKYYSRYIFPYSPEPVRGSFGKAWEAVRSGVLIRAAVKIAFKLVHDSDELIVIRRFRA